MPFHAHATIAIAWCMLLVNSAGAQPAVSDVPPPNLERGLLAHWPLDGNPADDSPHARHAEIRGGVEWNAPRNGARQGVRLNGRDAHLEVPARQAPRLGTGNFTIAAWVHLDDRQTDIPGDIFSQYDARGNRGFHLSIKTNAGVTTTQANYRQLQFGIDANQQTDWTDCGRPGNAVLAFALAVHDNQLWAGTCESGKDQAGHVYRYGGGDQWIDCGTPAPCNAVTALAEFEGKLYAGVGKYRLGGSSLAESENPHLGGAIYRYDGDHRWTACGQLPEVEAIGGMVVYAGRLYASSLYRPAGFFRYDGGSQWTTLKTPGSRVEALGVYNGHLYATSYDGGRVVRYDDKSWTDCGQLGDASENTQTYSVAVHHGRLFVGTWRTGRVYRFEDVDRWTDVGRLGQELEVMGMLVHNGRLLAGTLPLAEVYAFDGDRNWQRLAQLDTTPDVTYRRAWTMAEFDGRVFCSTLPSGRVYAYQAGASAMSGIPFPSGWHHVAATREGERLRLFLDGEQVAQSSKFDPGSYDLNVDTPLMIGAGANDFFCGKLSDVRLYDRALHGQELARLARPRK